MNDDPLTQLPFPLNWSEPPSAGIPRPLGRRAEHLVRSFQIGGTASITLLASFLAAVIGPSRRVRAEFGYDLPPGLNIAFVTESPLVLRTAVRRLFEPITKFIQKAKRLAGLMDPDWHRKTITRLRLELLQAQDVIDGIAPPSPPRERELDKEIEDQIAQFEGKTQRQQAAMKQGALWPQLSRVDYRLHPESLVEALEAGELLDGDALCFDSAIMNTSLGGETLRSLCHAPPQKVSQIARCFSASWLGNAEAGRTRPKGAQVSNLWITDHDSLAKALDCETIKASGVLDTFVFIEADGLAIRSNTHDSTDAWFRIVNHLFGLRMEGGEEEHRLGSEATTVYQDFVNELNLEWADLPTDVRGYAGHWPDLALKLSLLLHLGGHDPQPPEVNDAAEDQTPSQAPSRPPSIEIAAETVKTAVNLTKALGVGHVRLINTLGKRLAKAPDPAVEAMVRKIRLKQPVTRKNLYRSYTKQGCELHDPTLEKAITLGLVRQEGDFLTVDASSDRQRPQSGSDRSKADFTPPPREIPEKEIAR